MQSGFGTPTDPATGEPAEKIEKEKKKSMHTQEKSRLLEHAKLAQITDSEAAEALREMIRGLLFERISQMLRDDAQASAYVDVLNRMNEKESLARLAVEKLTRKGVS